MLEAPVSSLGEDFISCFLSRASCFLRDQVPPVSLILFSTIKFFHLTRSFSSAYTFAITDPQSPMPPCPLRVLCSFSIGSHRNLPPHPQEFPIVSLQMSLLPYSLVTSSAASSETTLEKYLLPNTVCSVSSLYVIIMYVCIYILTYVHIYIYLSPLECE